MNTNPQELAEFNSKQRLIIHLTHIMPKEDLHQNRHTLSLCLNSVIKTIASLPASDRDDDCELEAEMAQHAALIANYYTIYSKALKLMK